MKGLELLEKIRNSATVADILLSVSGATDTDTQSKRGNVFEKLWDIVIKFGMCDQFKNSDYEHFQGNIDGGILDLVDDLQRYVQNISVFSRGAGGPSDITLQHRETKKWTFISSKLRKDDDNYLISEYSVQDVGFAAKNYAYKYESFDIYLLVHDKAKVMTKIEASHTKSIKNNIHAVLDIADLERGFQTLKRYITDVPFDRFNIMFGVPREPLTLRFHQELFVHKINTQIALGEKIILIGAKPRTGKTFIVGGLLSSFYKSRGKLNALVISPSPKDTIPEFTKELFYTYIDFVDINIVEPKNSKQLKSVEWKENNIVVLSKQLLDEYVEGKTLAEIQQLNFDFIVFDENHFHGTTEMAQQLVATYSGPSTVALPLTGTFGKSVIAWSIPVPCQLYWNMEDERLAKNRDVEGLVLHHGEEVRLFLTNDQTTESLLSIYDNMPTLEILTTVFDTKYDDINTRIGGTAYGFSHATLVCGKFSRELDTLIELITGSNKMVHFPHKDLSFFGRINAKCAKHGSRTMLNKGDFTSQLWFLPVGIGMKIDEVSEYVKDRMTKNRILKNYQIEIVNSKKGYMHANLKKTIREWEKEAKKNGCDGLIILAGNQLTMGITLPMVDIVVLFNDTVSADKIVQMMFRCMTETIHKPENDAINSGEKKFGFVIDLNVNRVLRTALEYPIRAKNKSDGEKVAYVIDNNLIGIDSDLFITKENRTKLVEKLMDIWRSDPINNLIRLMRNIENEIISVDSIMQRELNKLMIAGCDKNTGTSATVKFDETSGEKLQSGRTITRPDSGGSSPEKKDEKEHITNVSLAKDVLPYIIPLICILTLKTKNNDVLEMLEIIRKNPELLDVFNDHTSIWWNKKNVIEFIKVIVEKYVNRNSSVYSIAIQFKLSMQSMIDKPKELLELINNCLKPKQTEKQEFGEVFTPMAIIHIILDVLDRHYINLTGRSIFSERHFKWFDPASGMGNFIVAVYLRLMDGLDSQIPDREERKKHILENMLYMSEIGKKNVFVCRQIFDINGQYKLNIHEGDTFTLDTFAYWGIAPHGFDVILGNPAYNKNGISSHTGKLLTDKKRETIWPKFIVKSFEWLKPDGFLAFINPLSWLKKSHSLHKKMLEKHIVWLKLWDNIKSLATINGKIPISQFILQNTPNKTNKKTDIISEIQSKKLTTISTEYLNPAYSIPLAFHNIFNKLIGFIETRKLQLEYNTKTIKSSGKQVKIPTDYTLEDMWAVDTFTIKDGLMVKKATEKHPDANKRKLIISNKSSFIGTFIDEGKISLTGNHKFYILGDNLELMKKLLGFKIINIIGHYTKYSQDFLDNDVFKYIPDIRKLGIADMTEDEFYTLVGFTQHEIQQIKNPASTEMMDEPDEDTDVAALTAELLAVHLSTIPPTDSGIKITRKIKVARKPRTVVAAQPEG